MYQITTPNLASSAFKANPYPFYAQLRAEAPVFRTILPNKQPAWLVTRYDDALALLKDERFVKKPANAMTADQLTKTPWEPGFAKPLTRNMLDLDGADHARLRTLVHKAFTPRRVEQLRERIQTLATQLLDTAQAAGRLEVIRDYALPIPLTIIAEMLGVPVADRAKFHRYTKAVIAVASQADLLWALPQLWLFMRYVRELLQRRRADPQDDLITALLQAEEAGDTLSQDELLAMVFLLLIAGHETTVNLIGSGVLALSQHPDQAELLRDNPALIKTSVEELLRYTSPVDMATERYAREDVIISGVTIPKGELVYGVIGAANRDERQFANPDTLDLTRDPNRHLAFGQGVHYCLGAPLARLEGQIAFTTLLARFPRLRLAQPVESLRWRRSLILRGLEQLPLAM